MFSFLKDHPFAVEAYFKTSLVLTFAVAKDEIQRLLPDCLQPDLFDDKWAFVAVAMVETKDLRPKGFPAFMGNNFILTGYRIFVRYNTSNGKRLRGLYILKSETNKKKMELFGNMFTHYSYTTTDIEFERKSAQLVIHSNQSHLHIEVDVSEKEVALPSQSPFSTWKEARRFAGPLPFTFSLKSPGNVLIIEGVREDWQPRPVKIIHHDIGFVNSLSLNGIRLANAFVVENIPYYWKKGKTDIWKP